jgi:hypothetical protein
VRPCHGSELIELSSGKVSRSEGSGRAVPHGLICLVVGWWGLCNA